MSLPESLSVLTAKGHGYQIGSGGVRSTIREDLSGAMGMADLTENENFLIRAKYLNEPDAMRDLFFAVWVFSATLGVKKGWKPVRGKPLFHKVAELAIQEVIKSNRCKPCNGTGETFNKKPCPECKTSGIARRPSARAIAADVGIDHKTWLRWEGRLNEVISELQLMEHSACVKIGLRYFEN